MRLQLLGDEFYSYYGLQNIIEDMSLWSYFQNLLFGVTLVFGIMSVNSTRNSRISFTQNFYFEQMLTLSQVLYHFLPYFSPSHPPLPYSSSESKLETLCPLSSKFLSVCFLPRSWWSKSGNFTMIPWCYLIHTPY